MRRLAADSDVIIENYKVGALARYGLDAASLRALYPRLVYCSVTGFGQDGPRADQAAYDFAIQAMGGLLTGRAPQRGGNRHPNIQPQDVFACQVSDFGCWYLTNGH